MDLHHRIYNKVHSPYFPSFFYLSVCLLGNFLFGFFDADTFKNQEYLYALRVYRVSVIIISAFLLIFLRWRLFSQRGSKTVFFIYTLSIILVHSYILGIAHLYEETVYIGSIFMYAIPIYFLSPFRRKTNIFHLVLLIFCFFPLFYYAPEAKIPDYASDLVVILALLCLLNIFLREQSAKLEERLFHRIFNLINDRIERLKRMAFIGEASTLVLHDLRRPLSSVQTLVHMINKNNHEVWKDSDFLKTATEDIQKGLNHVRNISTDILILSKETGPKLVSRHSVEYLNNVVRQACVLYPSADIEFSYDIKTQYGVMGHPETLQRLFQNCIFNAIDAIGSQKGRIDFVLESGPDNTELVTILDSANALPDLSTVNVFDAHMSTKGNKGFGLGLTISKRITELHHGSIHLSKTEDNRTAVKLTLQRGDRISDWTVDNLMLSIRDFKTP